MTDKLNTKIRFVLRTPSEVEATQILIKEMAQEGAKIGEIQEATGCSYMTVKKLADEMAVTIETRAKGKTFTKEETAKMRVIYMQAIGKGESIKEAKVKSGCTDAMTSKWNKERREGKL